MNKTYYLAICMLFLGYTAQSQNQFGVKAGLNLANQRKTMSIPQLPAMTQDTKIFPGYQLGLFYRTKPSRQFSFSAEANFSVIGSGMTLMTGDGKSYNTHDKLGYIDLPLILQYSINKIYFGLGPAIGIKLFSKLTNFENRTYDLPYYQTFDASGNLLAGVRITKRVDANMRYSHGFVNIYDNPGYAKTMNRFFNFSILYGLK
jgi:hypothetical protein